MEKKIKHLEFIQNIIARLSNNSFYIKGWAITVVSIIISLNNISFTLELLFLCNLTILIFWVLDSYFIYEERTFRLLYDEVRKLDDSEINFQMNLKNNKGIIIKRIKSFFSKTLLIYYPLIMALIWIIKIINIE